MDIRISAYPDNRIYGYPLIGCGGAVRLVLQALPCWLGMAEKGVHAEAQRKKKGAEEERMAAQPPFFRTNSRNPGLRMATEPVAQQALSAPPFFLCASA